MANISTQSGSNAAKRRAKSKDPSTNGAERCRKKFLRYFPEGFRDDDYCALERNYKVKAHERFMAGLAPKEFAALLEKRSYEVIASRALAAIGPSNLVYSFENMALRDALRSPAGARAFAHGLSAYLFGDSEMETRFNAWCDVIAALPRKQSRVFTWPVVTVFGFLAQPKTHIFLKPTVTKIAAKKYGFDFQYASRPSWPTYASYLAFARQVRADQRDLHPRDMIDIQSFLWVQGSEEY
jgi:hypothetical protein